MPNLIPLKSDKKPLPTADGSLSLYNITYAEGYHAKSVGAFTESHHKYFVSSGISEKIKSKDVRLLDICLGVGCNLAVTFSGLLKIPDRKKLHAVSLELDSELPLIIKNTDGFWPKDGYDMLRKLIYEGPSNNFLLDLYIGDGIKKLDELDMKFDVVYFDPFSKRRTPDFWTVEVFKNLYRLLADDGCVVTYSSGKGVRKDFAEAGFKMHDIAKMTHDFHKGTIFYK